jgi:pilus assembly protein CpaC
MGRLRQIFQIVSVLLVTVLFSAGFASAANVEKKKGSSHREHSHPGHNSVKSAIYKFFPREKVDVNMVGNSLVLSGEVSSAQNAARIEKLAKEIMVHHKILNFMQLNTGQQVMLRVRVGEVKKYGGDLNKYSFDQLTQSGIVRVLAEPNLVAMSGEQAEFLAGGEFPVPVAGKDDTATVEYKSYGVKVVFTPLVLAPNRIRLSVEPEISEINPKVSVGIRGMNVPAVSSRRAKTTVELAPGESFMIGSLVRDDFRGGYRKASELVIAVTPYLVDPVAGKDLRLPTDQFYSSSKMDKKFMDNLNVNSGVNSGTGFKGKTLEGPIGFMAD